MQSNTIWRRRAILMVVVGLVIAIPITLLIRDSGEKDEPEPSGPSIGERFPLNPPVRDSGVDASYRVPEGWKVDHNGEAVKLHSADKSVQIGITSPGPATAADQILAQSLDALRASYESVEVDPGSGKKVGGLQSKGAVVTAQGDKVDLRILVAVVAGEKKAYLVEVFTATSARPARVAEAQRFLDSLELKG